MRDAANCSRFFGYFAANQKKAKKILKKILYIFQKLLYLQSEKTHKKQNNKNIIK